MSESYFARQLKVSVLEDIVVTPFSLGSGKVFQKFSVSDSNASAMEHRRAHRSISTIDKYEDIANCTIIDEECLYAGPLFNHFGHFIAESISRLWAFVDGRDKPRFIAFHPIPMRGNYADELLPWMLQALKLFGVEKQDIVLIDKDTKFKRLIVPEQGSVLGAGPISKQYADCIQRLNHNHFQTGGSKGLKSNRLYVSRSRHAYSGSYLGEKLIEMILRDQAGFEIIHPERVSLPEIIQKFNNAGAIICSEGSAIHTLELCDIRESSVFLICRRRAKDVQHLFGNMLSRKECRVGISGEGTAITPLDWEPTRNTPAWQNASSYLNLMELISSINNFFELTIKAPDNEAIKRGIYQSLVDIILDARSTRKSTTDEQLGMLLRLLRAQASELNLGLDM